MSVDGTMVAVGRKIEREFLEEGGGPRVADDGENWSCVIELLSWFRHKGEEDYSHRHVCRFRGGFRALDVCANKRCIYVNPWATDDGWMHDRGQEQILVYPMMECHASHSSADATASAPLQPEYFPSPVAVLPCREAVTAVQTTGAGDIVLVATVAGSIQIWNVNNLSSPLLSQTVSCSACLAAGYKRAGRVLPDNPLESLVGQVPPFSHPSAVDELYVSRHLPIDQAGFVTLQHAPAHVNTLLLWKLAGPDKNEWRIQAQVLLPLASYPIPKVHFDGRKIVVLGQDHVGFLILTYQVLYSNEDLDAFVQDTESATAGVASSGGVVNFDASVSALRFARRIRHAALGDLDPPYMTCNERFIVLSTKTGHLCESAQFVAEGTDQEDLAYSCNEGLLVIDLEQQQRTPAKSS